MFLFRRRTLIPKFEIWNASKSKIFEHCGKFCSMKFCFVHKILKMLYKMIPRLLCEGMYETQMISVFRLQSIPKITLLQNLKIWKYIYKPKHFQSQTLWLTDISLCYHMLLRATLWQGPRESSRGQFLIWNLRDGSPQKPSHNNILRCHFTKLREQISGSYLPLKQRQNQYSFFSSLFLFIFLFATCCNMALHKSSYWLCLC